MWILGTLILLATLLVTVAGANGQQFEFDLGNVNPGRESLELPRIDNQFGGQSIASLFARQGNQSF